MFFVNLCQTNDERQQKYWLARSLGFNAAWATKIRDWRLAKIERSFGLTETYNKHTQKYNRQFNKAGVQALLQSGEPA